MAEQKSIRIVLPLALYNRMKKECPEHGEISRLIRKLLTGHLDKLDQNGDED